MKYFYESVIDIPELEEVKFEINQLGRWTDLIEKGVDSYLHSRPVELETHFNNESHFNYVVTNFTVIPFDLHDFFDAWMHSARNVLEYSAQVLACTLQDNPQKTQGSVKFPICNDEKSFLAGIERGAIGSPKQVVVDKLRSVQPYVYLVEEMNRNNTEQKVFVNSFLWQIQQASNSVKHVANPKLVLAGSPKLVWDGELNVSISPGSEMSIEAGKYLHSVTGLSIVENTEFDLKIYVEFKDKVLLLPLLGFIGATEWFLKYILLPTIFEPLMDSTINRQLQG